LRKRGKRLLKHYLSIYFLRVSVFLCVVISSCFSETAVACWNSYAPKNFSGFPSALIQYFRLIPKRTGTVTTKPAANIFVSGVGVATVVISFVLCTYYNVIISWALYYLFNSFRAVLPWQGCNHTWNSPACAEGSNATGNYSGDAVSATQDFFEYVRRLLSLTARALRMELKRGKLLISYPVSGNRNWLFCA